MLHISWTPKSSHQKDDLVCQLRTELEDWHRPHRWTKLKIWLPKDPLSAIPSTCSVLGLRFPSLTLTVKQHKVHVSKSLSKDLNRAIRLPCCSLHTHPSQHLSSLSSCLPPPRILWFGKVLSRDNQCQTYSFMINIIRYNSWTFSQSHVRWY